MAAPIVMSDEDLFALTGDWNAAAALRDQQNRALNEYLWSQPAPTPSNVLSGNILAGASWHGLNTTLADELLKETGQATTNVAVNGSTTGETLNQLNTFLANGGAFDPNATVYLQTGGVDFLLGYDKGVIKDNINQIVKTLGDQGVDVVLTGSPYAKSLQDVIDNKFDPKLDPIFNEIAKENKNVALVGVQGEILQNKNLVIDAVHTNAEGTAIYNQAVIDALSQFKNQVPSSTPETIAQIQQTNTVSTAPPVITQAASSPVVAPVAQASAIPAMPKTPTQVIKELVASGRFEQNPDSGVLIDGVWYTPNFASTGSGESFERGNLESVNVVKTTGGINDKVPVGTRWDQYSPTGEFQNSGVIQDVNATNDFMEFLSLAGAMFGAPAAIGQSLGLSGAAAQAAGQALLTTGTQLGAGADLGDAIVSGLKSGAIPATGIALGNVETFTDLPKPAQAAISSAVGSVIASGGKLDTGTLLSAASAALGASNKDNIGALEGLTNSGRTGDDMGGVYETTPVQTPTASLPNGIQVASLGNTPFSLEVGGAPIYAESSGASAVRPPAGYEVMSAKLADSKPAGSYYDATVNAWLQPTNEFARITDLNQVLADLETFKSGVNTIDTNAIKNVVEESLSKYPSLTADDVTRIIGGQNFATPQDIQAAISSINIPQGLSSQDVQSIVSTALANNPSLTANDVTKIISGQNFAKPEDIQAAIKNINIPQGLTTADVQGIVSKAFANNPSLTSAQVSQIVNGAISQIPAGLSANDVKSIVGSAISSLPKAPTTQDIVNIISGQGLASTSQLNQQGQQLMSALQKQGVDYNTALQQALKAQTSSFNSALGTTQANIDALAQSLGKTKEGLLAELNMTEADLQKQISGVQTSLGSQITNLSQQTQQQLAQQSAQTQQQFSTLSDAQKAQADALVKQGSTLSSAINQVQAGLGQQITNLSQQTQSQLAQQSAQTQQQFNSLTAAQKAQADALVKQGASFNTALSQVQSGLQSQLGSVQSGLESQLSAQGKQFMDSLQKQGIDYQTALNQAVASQANQFNTTIGQTQSSVDALANKLGVTKDELLAQLGTTEANANQRIQDLEKEFNLQLSETEQTLGGQIGNVQSSFEEQLAKANASNADAFAKVMLSLGAVGSTLGAIKDANTPKTYTYDVADTSKWASPVYNQATGPVAPLSPLDFGTRDLLKGTQWQKFLSPTYGQVPAPVQFNQPNGMGYDQLMSILGTGRDTLPSQALSINDVISGIQNQYGQAPKGSMG